jgi:Zn-dependent M28 family amino/carboxypeptidase
LELVFFDGEEALGESITDTDGLYGSRQYASTHLASAPKPRFAILLDMIGHRNLTIKIPSDTPQALRQALFATAAELGVRRHFDIASAPIKDDHVPLGNAGVPSIDVLGDFHPGGWWHSSQDNIHLLSAESLDISIRVTLGTLRRLLDEPPPR